MERTTQQFKIPQANLGRLEDALGKLAKRATRLGIPGPAWAVGAKHEDPVKDEITGFVTHYRVWYDFTLISEPVKLAGWTFLGTLDHTTEAGVILRAVPGIDLDPKYRTAEPVCDHCGLVRRRNETFVVRHEDGREKQVGRQCVADFLGTDPGKVALRLEYLALCRLAAEESEGWGNGGEQALGLTGYLSWVVQAINREGWVSRAVAREDARKVATADSAAIDQEDFYRAGKGTQPSEDDRKTAEAALAWIRELRDSGQEIKSDYLYNLVTVCASESVTGRNLGIAASLIPTYKREVEREILRRKQAAISQHVGTVGKRQTFTVTVAGRHAFESAYGTRWLIRLLDEAGNVIIWWTGGNGAFNLGGEQGEGKTFTVKATVKSHEDYKGIAQTVVSRLAVIEEHKGQAAIEAA